MTKFVPGRLHQKNAIHVSYRLNFAKRAMLAGAGMLALITPVVLGLLNAPFTRAQSSRPGPAETPAKFEVASIKPCNNTPDGPVARGGGAGGAGGGMSPGRITFPCSSVLSLIGMGYSRLADGRIAQIPIKGGPSWISSERYTIVAKVEDRATREIMTGPLLRALLEDRFKLKIRRETREMPVYKLTVARGGLKAPPFKEGSCTLMTPEMPALPLGQTYCRSMVGPKGPNMVIDRQGTTLEEFARMHLIGLGRPVIDATGITGRFDFYLEFAPGENAPRPLGPWPGDVGDSTAPDLFTALQEQLGLKLEPGRGPGDTLVIEHVERPSEN